jgi:Methyltransferase domain
MPENDDFEYTGSELLFTNEEALKNYNHWIVAQFVEEFSAINGKSALDFGAGIGSLCSIFDETTKVRPATLEVDAKQRDTLKKRGFSPYASIGEMSQNFDLIYTSNVLEHIEDDVATLIELRERISENGRIAIFVPAFKILWTSMDDKVGHHRRYTKKSLRAKLRAAGFTVEKIGYRDSIGFALALLFKVLGSKSGEPSYSSLVLFDRVLLPISRALDVLVSPFFGKNILAIARPIRNGDV